MKKSIFISYSEIDNNKMNALSNAINRDKIFQPIVVAHRKKPGKALSEKVKNYLNDCNLKYIVPIITKNSLNSQWVNQEIGYATAKNITVIPIIDSFILDKLKGFINKQIDLSFTFKSNSSNTQVETNNFKKSYKALLQHIKEDNFREKLWDMLYGSYLKDNLRIPEHDKKLVRL